MVSRDPQEGFAGERKAGKGTLVITMMMAELDARSVAADVSSGGGESSCEAFQHLISVAQGEARADGMPSPTIHLQDDHRPRQYQVTLRSQMLCFCLAYILMHCMSSQTELFERAKKENVIACLDTGAGKTLIAVMLLQVSMPSLSAPEPSLTLVKSTRSTLACAHQRGYPSSLSTSSHWSISKEG